MAGALIELRIDDKEVRELFLRLSAHTREIRPALAQIGQMLVDSVQENFERGGRPEKWPRSKKPRGKTLIKEGDLMGSINWKVHGNEAVSVGTDRKYGAIHQFGGVIRPKSGKYLTFRIGDRWVRKKEVTIPPRPYLVVQAEDMEEIKDILLEHILRGRKGR